MEDIYLLYSSCFFSPFLVEDMSKKQTPPTPMLLMILWFGFVSSIK